MGGNHLWNFTVFSQGQWWSIFITHRPHFRQWCDRGALNPSHTLQYCKNLRARLSCKAYQINITNRKSDSKTFKCHRIMWTGQTIWCIGTNTSDHNYATSESYLFEKVVTLGSHLSGKKPGPQIVPITRRKVVEIKKGEKLCRSAFETFVCISNHTIIKCGKRWQNQENHLIYHTADRPIWWPPHAIYIQCG